MANTSFSYMYRDASNWKLFETIVLEGELASEDIDLIMGTLEDHTLFLPEQVGLPALQKRWKTLNEDDHIWHELTREDIQTVSDAATTHMTAKELVIKFRAVSSWDVCKSDWDLWVDAKIDYSPSSGPWRDPNPWGEEIDE